MQVLPSRVMFAAAHLGLASIRLILIAGVTAWIVSTAEAGTRTWDDKYDTSQITLTVVYFVPSDRAPLVDWRERVEYYTRRIDQFHQREFQGQSKLQVTIHPEPFVSEQSTADLRAGENNGDPVFFRTLGEVDRRLKFANPRPESFPILLVLSEINRLPLDDFYRLHPTDTGVEFEGNYHDDQHFPGANSGGARAAYLSDRGVGWGLVSADGWRVPLRGSDCVIYHEGVGHTVGLPHPEPGNGSVMSEAQYRGWISESWLDTDQKVRLKWTPDTNAPSSEQLKLYTEFRALPEPRVPQPGEQAALVCDWPKDGGLKSIRVRIQTSLRGPWLELPVSPGEDGAAPTKLPLGTFDRPTPVSYRVNVELNSGDTAELWGYFQVQRNREFVVPANPQLLEF